MKLAWAVVPLLSVAHYAGVVKSIALENEVVAETVRGANAAAL